MVRFPRDTLTGSFASPLPRTSIPCLAGTTHTNFPKTQTDGEGEQGWNQARDSERKTCMSSVDPPASSKRLYRVVWGAGGGGGCFQSQGEGAVFHLLLAWAVFSLPGCTDCWPKSAVVKLVYQNPLEGSLKSSLPGLSPEVVIQWVLGGADNLHF